MNLRRHVLAAFTALAFMASAGSAEAADIIIVVSENGESVTFRCTNASCIWACEDLIERFEPDEYWVSDRACGFTVATADQREAADTAMAFQVDLDEAAQQQAANPEANGNNGFSVIVVGSGENPRNNEVTCETEPCE